MHDSHPHPTQPSTNHPGSTMKKRHVLLGSLLFAASIASSSSAFAQGETKPDWNEFKINEDLSLSLNGYLYIYNIHNRNSYFTDADAAFTEVSAALGMDFAFKDDYSGQFRFVGTGLYGNPDDYLGVQSSDMQMFMDLANVSLHTQFGGRRLTVTAGLQELMYGDGFLIMDGFSEDRAIWTTPVRSVPALKASLDLGETCSEGSFLDVFISRIRSDFMSLEAYLETGAASATGGTLTGLDLHLQDTGVGTLDLGVFYKDESSSSATDSDTLAISIRDELSLESMPLTLTTELVGQGGQTNVVNGSPGANRVDREAWGGHLTCNWQIADDGYKPYVQGRYVRFSGDSASSTNTSEAFDPMFYGWNDWGEWWIGDMLSFELPHSNSQSYVAEIGMTPTDATKLRLLYVNSSLIKSTSFSSAKGWAHEVDVVLDYAIDDNVFTGVMVGAAIPRSAAEAFNGDDKTNYEAILWVGFSF